MKYTAVPTITMSTMPSYTEFVSILTPTTAFAPTPTAFSFSSSSNSSVTSLVSLDRSLISPPQQLMNQEEMSLKMFLLLTLLARTNPLYSMVFTMQGSLVV